MSKRVFEFLLKTHYARNSYCTVTHFAIFQPHSTLVAIVSEMSSFNVVWFEIKFWLVWEKHNGYIFYNEKFFRSIFSSFVRFFFFKLYIYRRCIFGYARNVLNKVFYFNYKLFSMLIQIIFVTLRLDIILFPKVENLDVDRIFINVTKKKPKQTICTINKGPQFFILSYYRYPVVNFSLSGPSSCVAE